MRLSSDHNVECIADLVKEVKQWLQLKGDYYKISLIGKVVRLLKALIVCFIIFMVIILMLIYLSFAAAYAIGGALDSMVYGFLIVAAIYFLLIIILMLNRRSWIERPLVRFLAGIIVNEGEE